LQPTKPAPYSIAVATGVLDALPGLLFRFIHIPPPPWCLPSGHFVLSAPMTTQRGVDLERIGVNGVAAHQHQVRDVRGLREPVVSRIIEAQSSDVPHLAAAKLATTACGSRTKRQNCNMALKPPCHPPIIQQPAVVWWHGTAVQTSGSLSGSSSYVTR